MKMKVDMKLVIIGAIMLVTSHTQAQVTNGQYTLIVEGFDWGASASKVILALEEGTAEVNARQYEVMAEKNSSCYTDETPNTSGSRDVVYAYVSDEEGNHVDSGMFVTLHLEVGPYMSLDAPIQYFFSNGCRGNQWVDYRLTIKDEDGNVWNTESERIVPLVDNFDLTGRFNHNDDTQMSYASYKPDQVSGNVPLIIWLHGGGEGGTDPSIVLLANRAANYASPEIQEIFGGAHVLAPQSPTFWMQSESGEYTRGDTEDIYNQALMALFEDYINRNPDIDRDRIYVGGCSNGGYMTQKLLLKNPDFFAAALSFCISVS